MSLRLLEQTFGRCTAFLLAGVWVFLHGGSLGVSGVAHGQEGPSAAITGPRTGAETGPVSDTAAGAVAMPVQPRNSGPEAVAHTRSRQYRRKTVRIIRRTPEVMREDAARYRRGDIFSTWSNRYKE